MKRSTGWSLLTILLSDQKRRVTIKIFEEPQFHPSRKNYFVPNHFVGIVPPSHSSVWGGAGAEKGKSEW